MIVSCIGDDSVFAIDISFQYQVNEFVFEYVCMKVGFGRDENDTGNTGKFLTCIAFIDEIGFVGNKQILNLILFRKWRW